MSAMPLAVIPARGGSKRIPRKNARPFLGQPLIQRTVRCVVDSGAFERVVVSTDDAEIARLAEAAGAEVPFVRPANLADDYTPTAPVVRHALEEIEARSGLVLASACAVYATAALMTTDDLRFAAERFTDSGADVLFAAARHPAPIERSWAVSATGGASMRWPEHRLTRTQDLPESFYDVGWFYFGVRRYWETGGAVEDRVALHLIDRTLAIDIDTEEDWRLVEGLAEADFRDRRPDPRSGGIMGG